MKLDADLLSADEVDRLLRVCSKRAPTGRRNRALIAVLWRCGLRLGEALALSPKDVDLQDFAVRVQQGKTGKRVVGLDVGTALLIDQWLVSRKKLTVGPRAPSRFLACEFRLIEIDTPEAWGSLTEAYEQHFGRPPDYDEATGDAATGFYLPAPEGDVAQVVMHLRANGRAVRRALWLLAAKHNLDNIRLVTRPEGTTALWHDVDWQTVETPAYDQAAVTIWPPEPSWPVRDRVIISYTNEPTLFVHRARRDPRCDWCVPARAVEEALSFASVERARAWIDSRGASERHALAPTYRSVAAALLDQTAQRDQAAR